MGERELQGVKGGLRLQAPRDLLLVPKVVRTHIHRLLLLLVNKRLELGLELKNNICMHNNVRQRRWMTGWYFVFWW